MIGRLEEAAQRDVSRDAVEKLKAYAAMLAQESRHQNLISSSTMDELWQRHIFDSAQLVRFEPRPHASWLDVGSGGGLPGIVIGCIVEGPVTLLEPRRLRADFLHKVCESLRLDATVVRTKAERAEGKYDVITARAVGRLAEVLKISAHLSTRKTVWALPKGRAAEAELAEARRAWQGTFHVEHSVTEPTSFIVVGTDVRVRT